MCEFLPFVPLVSGRIGTFRCFPRSDASLARQGGAAFLLATVAVGTLHVRTRGKCHDASGDNEGDVQLGRQAANRCLDTCASP